MTDISDPSTASFPPPAEKPLGIQRPLLSPKALGQPMLQPKFLTPLGANSLTVLDPSVFSSKTEANQDDWQSPFQDSPFFDPPDRPRTSSQAISTHQSIAQPQPLNPASQPASLPIQASPLTASVPLSADPFVAPETLDSNSDTALSTPAVAQAAPVSNFSPAPPPPITQPLPQEPIAAPLRETNIPSNSEPPLFTEDSPNKSAPIQTISEPPATATPQINRVADEPQVNRRVDSSNEEPSNSTVPHSVNEQVAAPQISRLVDEPQNNRLVDDSSEFQSNTSIVELTANQVLEQQTSGSLINNRVVSESAPTSQISRLVDEPQTNQFVNDSNEISASSTITEFNSQQPPEFPSASDSVNETALTPQVSRLVDDSSEVRSNASVIESTSKQTSEFPTNKGVVSETTPTPQISRLIDEPQINRLVDASDEFQSNASVIESTSNQTSENQTSENQTSESLANTGIVSEATTTPQISRLADEAQINRFTDTSAETSLNPSSAESLPQQTPENPSASDSVDEIATTPQIARLTDEPEVNRSADNPDEVRSKASVVESTVNQTSEPVANNSVVSDSAPTPPISRLIDEPQINRFTDTSAETSLNPSSAESLSQQTPENPSASDSVDEIATTPQIARLTDEPEVNRSADNPDEVQSKASVVESTVNQTSEPVANNSVVSESATTPQIARLTDEPEVNRFVDDSDKIQTESFMSESSPQPSLNTSPGESYTPTETPQINRLIDGSQINRFVDEPSEMGSNLSEAREVAPETPSGESPESIDRTQAEALPASQPLPRQSELDPPVAARKQSPLSTPSESSVPTIGEDSSGETGALPPLPIAIQRLSVLEPLSPRQNQSSLINTPSIQASPASPSPASSGVPSSRLSSSTEPYFPILETQNKQDPDRSEPPAHWSNIESLIQPSREQSPSQSRVETDWSNIEALLQSSGESRFQPQPELDSSGNGYSDLNLYSESQSPPSPMIQREMAAPTTPPAAASPTPAASQNPQSTTPTEEKKQASPEQFERLAQEIYRLMRQRMALERERVGYPYSGRFL